MNLHNDDDNFYGLVFETFDELLCLKVMRFEQLSYSNL